MRNSGVIRFDVGVALFVVASVFLIDSAFAQIRPEPPEFKNFPQDKTHLSIRYGYALLAETPTYIGPQGKSGRYAGNKMACANCHLDVGARPFGNSWLDAHSLYPQFREREGKIQTLADRVNTCLKHNLDGKPLPVDGDEMRAILLYYKWLGRGRPVLDGDNNQRLPALEFMPGPADPEKGKTVYENNCMSCHGSDGAGRMAKDDQNYEFPPLWGKGSFSTGTSMSRLTILARFVKANMPYEAKVKLSDEEAWNVSAYVLAQSRPPYKGKSPFPSIESKPFDYPIGPYADPFPAKQHMLGPFKPIMDHWISIHGEKAARAASGI